MTRKLYYEDCELHEFDATVISCERRENCYAVILDKTAFFPEGGGQPGDTGSLGTVKVFDTHECNGDVVHYTDEPLEAGISVHGSLDFERRFRLMQNHSGEHIVSGIVYSKFGFGNVGFHMGSEDITVDYSGFIDRDALFEIEREANAAVCRNLPIKCEFPSPEELQKMHYRAKKELTGAVRIVTVEGYDSCACCAPHVSLTGEIGIIKILDSIKYKGGVRIHMHCGFDAIDDYNRKYNAVRTIANSMSVKQDDVAEAFLHYSEEVIKLRSDNSALKAEILRLKCDAIEKTEGNICLFEDGLSGDDIRKYADTVSEKCGGVCAVFSGKEGKYNYVMISRSVDLRKKAKQINERLNGRGGGSSEMIQGFALCSAENAELLMSGKDELWQM